MKTEIQSRGCQGAFNFMVASTTSSLFRNGRVMIRRNSDGDTVNGKGIEVEEHSLSVRNARLLDAPPTCATNGFELLHEPLVDQSIDFTDHAVVLRDYYDQCAGLVERATGARAFAFDHNVRSATGKKDKQRIAGGQHVQGPAHVVHGDYTLRSASERLQQLARPPSGNDTLLGFLQAGESLIPLEDATRALAEGGRFAIINVWRSTGDEPVATHPIALCDSQTVLPEDLVVFEIHYPDRVGENYFAKYSPRHEMYYYPSMTRDEALLIKQWDSAGPLARSNGEVGDMHDRSAPCSFSFHSAFIDPGTADDAPERRSIEVRCMAIYD